MKAHFTILAILCFTATFGQKAPVKFGDVSVEDLKMTKYEKDSSAEAVVLADYGESVINYNQNEGFVLNFQRIRRVKILTKEGLKWADFSVELYHNATDDEKLSGLKAVTYNLEHGKIIESKVKDESIFKEKHDGNWNVIKITWPNVKAGSILEISYKINSDFLFNFQDWQFQYTIPVVWSEYRARIPEYFNYSKYMQGYIPLVVKEESQAPRSIMITSFEKSSSRNQTFQNEKIDYQENSFRWATKDVPAFKSEPFMTTYTDFISQINFELAFTKFPNQPIKNYMGTWEDISKTYFEDAEFGGQIKSNGFLKKTVDGIISGISSPEAKVKAINDFVKQNVIWDGTKRKYVSKSLKKVLEEKKGNAAEVNLLLTSMLEKADFEVAPVLLSTRDHGFLRQEIPVSSQFNYVICLVKLENKSILLDATEKLLPVGCLPERCLNGSGLAISEKGFEWVKLQSLSNSKTVVNLVGVLNDKGELKGKLQIDRSGYDALNTRKKYISKGEVDYIKEFVGSRQWEIDKSEIKNVNEIHEPFRETHEGLINDQTTVAGDIIYFDPFVILNEESNPFKSDKREYPVDFGSPTQNIYMAKIEIPEGFTVDELPKGRIIAMPNSTAKYSFNTSILGNTINLISNFQINKSLFLPDEYTALREFYSQVIAKQAEQIVLKRK